MAKYTLTINEKPYTVEAAPDTPLLWVIRDLAGLTGTKYGCGIALCGACTVHLNGQPVRSCMMPVSSVRASQKITTVEGLSEDNSHVLQQAWIEEQVPQCGYCQSGMLMSAAALLRAKPSPTDEDIDSALAANLCRCGTYPRVKRAIHRAAGNMKK
ncbi:MAG: Isoquinoline 1-oxidoreductase subunit alpha [Haliscomenobacter sp.]|jgi:isoquinoline 1-oxidoreductase alpha subunit|nr:Isoquinoline 1-oxidoreductase subunit alpha [Haliscomenobacter sp.]